MLSYGISEFSGINEEELRSSKLRSYVRSRIDKFYISLKDLSFLTLHHGSHTIWYILTLFYVHLARNQYWMISTNNLRIFIFPFALKAF